MASEKWICTYGAATHHPSGRKISVHGRFDGAGDVKGKAIACLNDRLRRRHLWYGVEFLVITPLEQKVRFVYEE